MTTAISEYHARRAREELVCADRARTAEAKSRHRELSALHSARACLLAEGPTDTADIEAEPVLRVVASR